MLDDTDFYKKQLETERMLSFQEGEEVGYNRLRGELRAVLRENEELRETNRRLQGELEILARELR